jgi:hypothetical protein
MKGPGDQRQAVASTRLDLLDQALFIPCICIAGALGFSLRLIGAAYLLIPLLCVVYASYRKTSPPRILSAYLALCLLSAALSHYRVFPSSWQVFFLDEAIGRQVVPVISFFAVAWASKAYFWRRLPSGDIFVYEPLILFLCLVCAPLVMIQQGVSYQNEDATDSVLAAYGAFINNVTIAMFFILGRLFFTAGWSRAVAGATIALIAVTTHFAQFRILTLAALATLLGIPARFAAVVVTAGLTMVYAAQMPSIPELMVTNPNAGLRLIFIEDTISSLKDTRGLGIGYGTESVRWTYRVPGQSEFQFMPDVREITQDRLLQLLSRGVHNSFAQAALRMGVPGLLLLVFAFCAAFPPRSLPRPVRSHASMLFVIIFLASFVNPALESPVQVVGIGFLYGYLLALRGRAEAWCRVSRPSSASLPPQLSLIPN